MSILKKIIFGLAVLLLLLMVIAGAAAVYVIYWPLSPRSQATVEMTVRWGASLGSVAQELEAQGVVRSADQFKLTAKLFGKTQKLRVGRFSLHKGSSNHQALWALLEGPQSFIDLTLPRGYDSRRFAGIIAAQLQLDSTRIMELVRDPAFIVAQGIDAPTLEGYLYPETYRLTFGMKEEQVLQMLVQQFKSQVPDSLMQGRHASGLDFNNILTLASIIEGEAMFDDEMPVISSVYHNRLKLGMKLQADPTIQYLIPDGPRRLLLRDLRIDSPYNTYLYAGLPPTPINNPSVKAIRAALQPADTDYLFFVAVGNGRHTFSRTYGQHLNAKRRFDEVRRQVERERRAGQ